MKAIDCPTCKKRVEPGAPAFPFCSSRCRLIDLGNWLGGRYRIAGEPAHDERDENDAVDEKGNKNEP